MEKKKIITVMTCLVNEDGECHSDRVVAVVNSYATAKKVLAEDVFDTLARGSRKWRVEVIRDDDDDYQLTMHLLDAYELTRWYYLDEVDYYEEE